MAPFAVAFVLALCWGLALSPLVCDAIVGAEIGPVIETKYTGSCRFVTRPSSFFRSGTPIVLFALCYASIVAL
jgi:hypothetical protein